MIMLNKKTGIICTLLFCSFMMTSCEKAPKREQNDSLEKEINLYSEQYISVQEAKEQILELEGQNVGGIHLPEHIFMPDIQNISEVKLTPWYPKQKEDMETVIKNIWNDYDNVDWTSIEEINFSNQINEAYYGSQKEDEQTGFLYSYDSDGFFSGDSLNDTENLGSSCVKEFNFEWGDSASKNDTYMLEDGEILVSDAVSYVEEVFNKNLSELEKNKFEYKVQHLYVMKNADTGCYDYNMVIGRIYNSVMLDTSSDFCPSQRVFYEETLCGAHMIAIMRHKKSIDYVSSCRELFDIQTETVIDKIISPIWAVQLINEEIAHEGGMGFSDCGLVYVLVQDNMLKEDYEQDVYQQVNNTTYMRPVWLFMSEGGGMSFETLTKDYHGTSVVVDAIDGTIYYYEKTATY